MVPCKNCLAVTKQQLHNECYYLLLMKHFSFTWLSFVFTFLVFLRFSGFSVILIWCFYNVTVWFTFFDWRGRQVLMFRAVLSMILFRWGSAMSLLWFLFLLWWFFWFLNRKRITKIKIIKKQISVWHSNSLRVENICAAFQWYSTGQKLRKFILKTSAYYMIMVLPVLQYIMREHNSELTDRRTATTHQL